MLVPDRLPAVASAGEKRMFAALAALGDDALVTYEPVVTERYPDFVVIEPSLGVFVVEVKGIRLGAVKHVDWQAIVHDQAGQTREAQHPVRQARGYMNALMRQAERQPVTASALVENGRFAAAFGHLVFLSQIDRASLDASPWAQFFPRGQTVCRDELPDGDDAKPILAMLRAALPAHIAPRPLDRTKLDSLRAVVHPQAVIAFPADGSSLRILDIEQEQAAASVGSGHRIFYGVPGSGKTVMLIARARLLAEGGQKVLFLCYNKRLRDFVSDALAAYGPSVDVVNFHAWARRQGAPLDLEDAEAFGRSLLTILERGGGESQSFDAVLIDEGQDFSPVWFTCAKLALREPEDGDLVIAHDEAQSLYGRGRPRWSAVGVRAQGRTDRKRFLKNYRNTRQIVEIAGLFGRPAATVADDDGPVATPLDPGNCRRSGPAVILRQSRDLDEELRFCDHVLRRLSEGDAPHCPRDGIAVLCPWRRENLAARLTPEGRKLLDRIPTGTIHSAKGLQWPAVVVIGAGHVPSEDPALLYVALTRAEDHLVVTWSRDTPLTRPLAALAQTRNA